MQECKMEAREADALMREFGRSEQAFKVHHQHLGNGQVRVRQVFTGRSDREVYEKMDRARVTLEQHGATNIRRTKIGRNSACACGSGRKFKKCCEAELIALANRA